MPRVRQGELQGQQAQGTCSALAPTLAGTAGVGGRLCSVSGTKEWKKELGKMMDSIGFP